MSLAALQVQTAKLEPRQLLRLRVCLVAGPPWCHRWIRTPLGMVCAFCREG